MINAGADVRVIVGTVPDIRELPEPRLRALSESTVTALVETAERYNNAVKQLAARKPRAELVDLHRAAAMSRAMYPEYIPIGECRALRDNPGDTPDHLFPADERHLGTIGQGLLENQIISALNKCPDFDPKPFSTVELLEIARRWDNAAAKHSTAAGAGIGP